MIMIAVVMFMTLANTSNFAFFSLGRIISYENIVYISPAGEIVELLLKVKGGRS